MRRRHPELPGCAQSIGESAPARLPATRGAHYTAGMENPVLQLDIAIIGGGIAGLWALNQLRGCGYNAALLEERALGGEQTAASQGIIHSGIKYHLSDAEPRDPDVLSSMPTAWRECLAGLGTVDLRGCRVLSEHVYLWSTVAFSAGLTTRIAGESLPSPAMEVAAHERPVPLQAAEFHGQVYRVDELVLDIPSLVETLAAQQREAIFRIDWRRAALQKTQGHASLVLPHCTVQPQLLLLTAGAGNAALIAALGAAAPAMQRRPLQQVFVKHQYEPAFFAHCVGSKSSPRLTITSHRSRAGEPMWSLGGDLATEGAHDDPNQLIARAQQEIAEVLPWLDLGASEWRTSKLDRAEPRLQSGQRVQNAFIEPVAGVDNVLAVWPVKLCLCPDLGDRLQRHLAARNILPAHNTDFSALHPLGQSSLAPPCWDTLFA
jgi:glycerol-3-phosphate dehydrogenase